MILKTMTRRAPLVAAFVGVCLLPGVAQAQETRFRVSFGAAAAAASGEADLALSGSFGYRFSERLWFEADVTGIDAPVDRYAPYPFLTLPAGAPAARVGSLVSRQWQRRDPFRFDTTFPALPTDYRLLADTDGSTVIGTLGLRYELPVQGGRLRPYLAGGLGLARTEAELSITPLWLPAASPSIETVSHTGFAASAGLGASFRVVKSVSLDADARYFRLSRDRNLMRLGGGVSVRF